MFIKYYVYFLLAVKIPSGSIFDYDVGHMYVISWIQIATGPPLGTFLFNNVQVQVAWPLWTSK